MSALRGRVDCPIVLGGAGYSLFPEALLDFLGADYGVAGEGEAAFLELVEALESDCPPSRRVIRATRSLDPTALDGRARNEAVVEFYAREGGMLNIQTKRGCPHRCAYCSYPILEGAEYRFRPASDVADEFEWLRDRHGAEYIAITDSVFNDARGKYLEIAEELARRDLGIPWMCFMRPARFKPDEVALLERAGLCAVEWGTDCSTDATLSGMLKDFTWDEVEESNRLFGAAGIANAHFIIFGGPGETDETVREGLGNISRLERCVVFAFCGVRVLPGTAIHRAALAEGLVSPDQNLLDAAFYFSPRVGRDRLHEAILASFQGRVDRVYPPGQDLDKIRAFHRMGYHGPIWDLLLGAGGPRARRPRAAKQERPS
jgi:radical SAM superfamily enzyme YgiQ (UPF0313 family)